jgi:hypothetical protein
MHNKTGYGAEFDLIQLLQFVTWQSEEADKLYHATAQSSSIGLGSDQVKAKQTSTTRKDTSTQDTNEEVN